MKHRTGTYALRWLLGFALALALALGLSATAAAEDYNVWVKGIQVTDANKDDVLGDGTVRYTPATATLTLSGATITSTGSEDSHYGAAIAAEGDLTIDVTADSSVTGPDNNPDNPGSSDGIYVDGDVTVTGIGTLTAIGGKATGQDWESSGVYADGGSVTVNGTLIATGGTATGQDGFSSGVSAHQGSVTVAEGGTLTATGGAATGQDGFSYGVDASVAVTVSGTLKATGGTATYSSYGVYTFEGSVTVSGTLNATGGKANSESCGVDAYKGVTVEEGGTLTATGGKGIGSYGVQSFTGDVTVNGTLNATGGTADSESCGVYAYKGVTVEEGGMLNATGGATTAGTGGFGSSVSSGVSVTDGSIVDVKDGSVLIATGNTQAIDGNVSNAIAGTGWTDAAGQNPDTIEIDTTGRLLPNFKRVQFPDTLKVYHVWVGGVQVTELNKDDVLGDGKVSYTPEDTTPATLKLNGATITGGHTFVADAQVPIPFVAAIYAEEDLTIEVTGTNTVTPSTNAIASVGILDNGSLIVTGSGTLNATGGEGVNSVGVLASGAVTVAEGGTLTAEGGEGTINAGVMASAVTVNGTLTAIGGEADGASYGVVAMEEGLLTVAATGTLTAAGNTQAIDGTVKNDIAGTGWTNTAGTEGKANIDVSTDQGQSLTSYKKVQFPVGYPVWVRGKQVTELNKDNVLGDGKVTYTPAVTGATPAPAKLTLNGATITSTGSEDSYYGAAIYAEEDLTIEVTAESRVTGPNNDSGASYGINSIGTLTVTGSGTLIATGGTATNDTSYGVSVMGPVTVAAGGTLNATGGTAAGDLFGNPGVYASGAVTVAEGGTLTATGGTATGEHSPSYGIFATTVTVNGTLTATGGESMNAESCGICVPNDELVTVAEGCTLIAAGNTQAINGTVNNDIEGTGWTDAAGTRYAERIYRSFDQGQTLSYGKVQFPGITLYPVWVRGVTVTELNKDNVLGDGKVSYTPATTTTPAAPAKLTLSGATITSTGSEDSHEGAAIYAEEDLTIDVTGTNTVTGPGNVSGSSNGIYVGGDVTVTGTGTLIAKGDKATNDTSSGVWAYGAVTVSGTLNATGGETTNSASYGVFANGNVTVNGTLNATGNTSTNSSSYGVYAQSGAVTVNGTLTATGGTANNSCGVYTLFNDVTVNGTLNATGGTANNSYGVFAGGNVTVATNSTLTATGGTQAIGGTVKNAIAGTGWTDAGAPEDIGVNTTGQTLNYKKVMFPEFVTYPVWVRGVQVTSVNKGNVLGDGKVSYTPAVTGTNPAPAKLTLNGATITSTGGEDSHSYAAIYAKEDLTIDVTGTNTVTGSDNDSGSSAGIYVDGDVTVTGSGTLTATGGKAMIVSAGVYAAYKAVTVDVGSTLTATGGDMTNGSGGASFGVLASVVTVSGTLNATGGTAQNGSSYGVYTQSSQAIVTINTNCTLTAAGNTQAIYGSVKNAIAGTGWTDAAGTTGQANIDINTDPGQSLPAYKRVQFPVGYPVWVLGKQVTELNKDNVLGDGKVIYTPAVTGATPAPAKLTLNGATIKSTGGEDSRENAAIYAEEDLTIDVTGTNTVTGPESVNTNSSTGIIVEGDVIVTGSGTLTAKGGTTTDGTSGGIAAGKNVTVATNSTLTATGGTAAGMNRRSIGVLALGAVTVAEGGTLNAEGGTATDGDSIGVCAYSGSVTVAEGGTLNAEGGTATGDTGVSFGVYAETGSVTVAEGGTLKAEGGTAAASVGIATGGDVTVNTDSTLTAAGSMQAIYGSVKNAVAGTGWTNREGTGSGTPVEISATARTISADFKKVYFGLTEPVITGADLVLDGTLTMRFHVALPAGFDDSSAHMSFTVHGRSIDVPLSKAGTVDGRRTFPCPVYSIEMAEPIKAEFHYTKGGAAKTATLTSSVKAYLDKARELFPDKTQLIALIDAVQNYGHYIQPYLARLHKFKIGAGGYAEMPAASGITPVTAQKLDGFKTKWHDYDRNLLESVTYYDTFDTSTFLNIQVKLKSARTLTATVNGAAVEVTALGGNVYAIRTPGIAANNLGIPDRVVFYAGSTVICDIDVSALTYVRAVLASRSEPNERNALTAFYNYCTAATAYMN